MEMTFKVADPLVCVWLSAQHGSKPFSISIYSANVYSMINVYLVILRLKPFAVYICYRHWIKLMGHKTANILISMRNQLLMECQKESIADDVSCTII